MKLAWKWYGWHGCLDPNGSVHVLCVCVRVCWCSTLFTWIQLYCNVTLNKNTELCYLFWPASVVHVMFLLSSGKCCYLLRMQTIQPAMIAVYVLKCLVAVVLWGEGGGFVVFVVAFQAWKLNPQTIMWKYHPIHSTAYLGMAPKNCSPITHFLHYNYICYFWL